MAIIKNDRDILLQAAPYRLSDTVVTITSTAGAFNTAKNGGSTLPANITLTATVNNVFTAACVKTWHYSLSSTPTTWVSLGTGDTKVITAASVLAIIGTSTEINYRCIVTEALLNTAYDYYIVKYSKEVSDPIAVNISRTNAVIPSNSSGTPLSYTNTDTVITVTRGSSLNYSATANVANTFTVAAPTLSTGLTIAAPVTTATSYGIGNITGVTQDYSTATFIVTIYNAQGVAESPTVTRQIVYTKLSNGASGGDATVNYIESSSPVITKSTYTASAVGTHSNITVTGKRIVGSAAPITAGYITITANGDTEAALATLSPVTTSINNTAGKTQYTVKLYNQATVSGATLLDTEVIPVIFTGSSAITAVLSNDATTIPTNSSGTAGIYTNSGTNIYVYEGTASLVYDGSGISAGTWTVSLDLASNITIGTITDGGTFATVGVASNITADTASLRYLISGTNLGGQAFSITKTQTFSKSLAGATGSSTFVATVYLQTGSPPATPTAGTGSYNFSNSTLTPPAGWSISQPPTSTTPTYASSVTFTGAPTDTVIAGTWSAVRLEAVNGAAGTNGEYRDMVQLFGTTATVPPGNTYYNFTNNTISSTTPTVTTVANWSLIMPTVTTAPVYVITSLAKTTTPLSDVTLTSWTSPTVVAQKGATGDPGASGTKSITVSAFKWSNTGIGTFTQVFTYTWVDGSGIVYPSGWTASAPAAPGTGYTLYQINLVISALATDPTTATNWSAAVSNTIGYREDGSPGIQGNSHRTAYTVTTSATAPTGITAGTGDVAPTAPGIWSYTATSTLAEGEYLYQVDGILTTGGNITWNSAYLSNLKVGSLSAISANLGSVTISTTGSLYSTGKTYAGATGGVFLGYSSTAYKFDVGNSTNYLRWDGTSLIATGITIKDTAGNDILVAGASLATSTLNIPNNTTNVPAGWLNSNVTTTTLGAATTTDVNNRLSAIGADSLTGPISLSTSTAILVGNTTDGLYLGSSGLVGRSGGTTTFSISSSGTALFKGDVVTGGDAQFSGKSTSTRTLNIGGSSYSIDYSSWSDATTNATSAAYVRGGVIGYASATTSAFNVGIIGVAPSTTKGIGVCGEGGYYGGYFNTTNASGYGIVANNTAVGGYALATNGLSLLQGNVSVTGSVTASSNITAYSDLRLKEDLQIISSALDKVRQLTGYTFTRKDTGERQTGLIAQEVQAVLPEAVEEGKFLSIAYGNMIGLLVEAIKELDRKISK